MAMIWKNFSVFLHTFDIALYLWWWLGFLQHVNIISSLSYHAVRSTVRAAGLRVWRGDGSDEILSRLWFNIWVLVCQTENILKLTFEHGWCLPPTTARHLKSHFTLLLLTVHRFDLHLLYYVFIECLSQEIGAEEWWCGMMDTNWKKPKGVKRTDELLGGWRWEVGEGSHSRDTTSKWEHRLKRQSQISDRPFSRVNIPNAWDWWQRWWCWRRLFCVLSCLRQRKCGW